MNFKKEMALKQDTEEFLITLNRLNSAYITGNEMSIYKNTCKVERWATRLYTHFEDWTTSTNDMQYKNSITEIIYNRLVNKELHENLKQFIEEQQEIDGMMYYTYILVKKYITADNL